MEHEPIHATLGITGAVERAVRLTSGTVTSRKIIPSFYSGGDFRFRVDGVELPAKQPAASLETASQVILVFPPDEAFVRAVKSAAREPASYGENVSFALSTGVATVSAAKGPKGETVVTALVDTDAEPARWRHAVADYTEVDWQGRKVHVIVAGRVFGMIGRLDAALKEERRKGPLIGIARGNIISSIQPNYRGGKILDALERLGLKYSAVASMELRHFDKLSAYRSAHPDGIRFLAANLVYSSATASTFLPAYEETRVDGLRVAFVGLTPTRAGKYLPQAGLSHLTVLDPFQTLDGLMATLRPRVDAVVILLQVDDETSEIAVRGRGADIVAGKHLAYPPSAQAPGFTVDRAERGEFFPPLWVMGSHWTSLNLLEAKVSASEGASIWSLRETHRLLDDSLEPEPGWPEFDPADFGITYSTGDVALIPASRALFPSSGAQRTVGPREFWSMASGLAAQRAGAELGILRAWDLPVTVMEEVPESVVRTWLHDEESAVVVSVRGAQLRALLTEVDEQRRRESLGLNPGPLPYVYGGVGAGHRVDGAEIDDNQRYRVFTSRVLADALSLGAEPSRALGKTVDEIVLEAVKARAGSRPEEYRSWMEGGRVDQRGLWRVNFRDVGLNIQNTKVVRDDAFNNVPNSRIQGFDELLIGGVFKTDAEYLDEPYRWTNTLEMEYARSRLRPRDAPPVTNTTANRITAITTGSRRAGLIKQEWLAKSWGPSLGFQYDGQFEAAPGLRRKQIYSAYPGVSFHDGTWIRLLELSGNVKRDLSRDPPNTQPGLHTRMLVYHELGKGPVKLEGDFYTNYFFLTKRDTAQDLRVEGDLNLKLRVPIRTHLSISPFVDFYFFQLKTKPLWGYSAMTGVQIGFSRLWKPQYEPLLGDR